THHLRELQRPRASFDYQVVPNNSRSLDICCDLLISLSRSSHFALVPYSKSKKPIPTHRASSAQTRCSYASAPCSSATSQPPQTPTLYPAPHPRLVRPIRITDLALKIELFPRGPHGKTGAKQDREHNGADCEDENCLRHYHSSATLPRSPPQEHSSPHS